VHMHTASSGDSGYHTLDKPGLVSLIMGIALSCDDHAAKHVVMFFGGDGHGRNLWPRKLVLHAIMSKFFPFVCTRSLKTDSSQWLYLIWVQSLYSTLERIGSNTLLMPFEIIFTKVILWLMLVGCIL